MVMVEMGREASVSKEDKEDEEEEASVPEERVWDAAWKGRSNRRRETGMVLMVGRKG
jgi:hypothetical protein